MEVTKATRVNSEELDFPSRLSRVETTVESLADDVRQLVTLVSSQQKDFQLRHEELNVRLGSIGKPNWQALAAGLTLLVLVLSLVGGMGLAPLYSGANYTAGQLTELKLMNNERDQRLARELREKISDVIVYRDEVVRRLEQKIDYEAELSKLRDQK